MKKLFTMLGVLLCGTMAYAQSEVITIEDVNMKPGTSETLYVKINEPTKYTAFQLDLKLPKGVKVDGVGMGGAGSEASTRELKNACIDEANNTYRFLAYDMENTKLGEKMQRAEQLPAPVSCSLIPKENLLLRRRLQPMSLFHRVLKSPLELMVRRRLLVRRILTSLKLQA